MFRAVSELVGARVSAAGRVCGRVRDVYFDARVWAVRHVVLAVGTRHDRDDLRLITPAEIISCSTRQVELGLDPATLGTLPSASSVKPVCKQYEALGFGSPSPRLAAPADPHLRSWLAVREYPLEHEGEPAGHISELMVDEGWGIRCLRVSQTFSGKLLHFHILPLNIEAISFARRRVILRTLQPVHLNEPVKVEQLAVAGAA